ncbi:beta-ketoacyl-ACP synthase [Achromobacter aloeverae]|uniref:Beta-ketoacyl-[acyl-carrier-protein] synthase II n=1 Tax=Achromobacter aloeverae TaxID=1750518 RepID=A0A4Q1HNX3_9BURK|nr:beta-ketoacyl-ACP synthase [Achromobacter aloeverae]RXN92742.1 beta-ketoacyl-[acyl-carrier-protein] synthase II [Achromobacter aloeverae]
MTAPSTAWLGRPGVVCALGQGMDAVHAATLRGETAGMTARTGWLPGRSIVVGAAAGELDELPATLADGKAPPPHYHSRNNRLLMTAANQIADTLRAAIARHGATRVGIVLGTSTSGIGEASLAFRARQQDGAWPPDYDYRRQTLAAPATLLADWLGIAGPAYTLSTACTSGARALLSAKRLLDAGLCDAVICGGVDALCPLTINGFASIEAIAAGLSNPYSAHRDGINIGEAAALFLMQRERPQGAAVRLLGGGGSSDAWHMSAPDPTGQGAILAMRAALRDAGVAAADIGWINLHGTGTTHNDAMESHAVHAVFPQGVPCTTTKPLTGHTLAAAGALEAALCWAVLDPASDGALPPQRWDGEADPALPPLRLTAPGERLPAGRPRIVMSNSFAFGGNNTCLVLAQADDAPPADRAWPVGDWPVAELLPHTGAAVLLDAVLACDEETLRASATVRRHDAYGDDAGELPPWLGLELMAQAVGAWAGCQARRAGEPMQLGFLLGTRRYDCRVPAFTPGMALTITVERSFQDTAGMGVFLCEIHHGAECLAQARLNVYRPPDPGAFIHEPSPVDLA